MSKKKTKSGANLENQKDYTFVFSIIVLILALVQYANTIGHDYALDDAIVLSENQFTKQGFSGIKDLLSYDTFTGFFGKEKQLVAGGRYRPFSLITFAIDVWHCAL